ncbi:hypothetical protein GB992_09820 [Lactobacillus rossiae]|uniref:Uncharacterized protein n=1 Tax=Furfurilactobacillus rossiae TaxID=231049 RepID=A0A7C9MS13_9LACO|nr:hypothetical protein [Furfurilactobacillus milii]
MPKPWEKLSNNVEAVTFGGFPNETAFGLRADFWAIGARFRRVMPKPWEKFSKNRASLKSIHHIDIPTMEGST